MLHIEPIMLAIALETWSTIYGEDGEDTLSCWLESAYTIKQWCCDYWTHFLDVHT